jgi:phosphatidylglycerol:prolipoprotein diacylglycerol transferase
MFTWLLPEPVYLYALAMAACMIVFYRRCAYSGLSSYHALGAAIWAMLGGLIGSRVFYLLQHMDRVAANPSIVLELGGGTVSWGAYLFGALAFWFYFLFYRRPVGPYADVLASCLGLGPFIGRWACFLNGDDYGTLSSAPWSVVYPQGSYPFWDHVRSGLIESDALYSLPVHPVQLYFSLNGLMLFIVITWTWRRFRMRRGTLFLLYWGLYSFGRFFLEFFRGDINRGFVGPFSTGQFMSLIIFFIVFTATCKLYLVEKESCT